MKPKSIEVGKCYRLYRWAGTGIGSREPGDAIVHVSAIEGKAQRRVRLEFLIKPADSYGEDSYSGFLRRVHSEVLEAGN